MSSLLTLIGSLLSYNGSAITGETSTVALQSSKSYTVSSGGSITISPDTGYGAMEEVSLTVPYKAAATYTPTTSAQTIAAGQWLNGAQTIAGDPNLASENIKSGVSIFGIPGAYEGIIRKITNDTSITPTGTYATSTYYNTTYGVKIGYMYGGNIILTMQGGSTTSYEYLYFQLGTVPSGVTLANVFNPSASSSYVTGYPGIIYACVISGLTSTATMSIAMNGRNATYDYTTVTINITAT